MLRRPAQNLKNGQSETRPRGHRGRTILLRVDPVIDGEKEEKEKGRRRQGIEEQKRRWLLAPRGSVGEKGAGTSEEETRGPDAAEACGRSLCVLIRS